MLLKSFISLAIIITIATGWARANLYTADNKLANFPKESLSALDLPISRIRRSIGQRREALASDIPKDQLYTGSLLRPRRQTPPGESDVPKELQNVFHLNRAKRQMPSPPGDMPMPPM